MASAKTNYDHLKERLADFSHDDVMAGALSAIATLLLDSKYVGDKNMAFEAAAEMFVIGTQRIAKARAEKKKAAL